MKCSNCNKELNINDSFCSNCGQEADGKQASVQKKQKGFLKIFKSIVVLFG